MSKYIRYNPLFILWHVLRNDIHHLEYDPRTQWRYHLIMTRYWVANFPVVIVLFFWFPHLWIAIALFLNTIYSLYANLATDFGAVPSSYGAMKAQEISDRQQNRQSYVEETPGNVIVPVSNQPQLERLQ